MTIDINGLRSILGSVLVRLPQNEHDDLWESGLMDSMSVVALVAALEERYGVEFGPTQLRKENFRSLDQIRRLLESISPGEGR